MAMISIKDYIDIGTGGVHNATSWQIAKDNHLSLEDIYDYNYF